MMQTRVLQIDPANPAPEVIIEAGSLLRKGSLVAFPTETVYGLGANLTLSSAMERLHKLKDRPKDKPFSLLIPSVSRVEVFASQISPLTWRFFDKFWPGPLTILLLTRDGAAKVGLRLPKYLVTLALLEEAVFPIVATSANRHGRPAPVDAQAVREDLGDEIELILDSGPTPGGKESTVIDLSSKQPVILREGAIPREELLAFAKTRAVTFVCTGNSCRSVMAHGILKKLLGDRKDILIYDGGVGAYPGMAPSKNTLELLENFGVDLGSHRAKRVSRELLQRSDSIFVMEAFQKEELIRMLPEAGGRVHLLGEFAKGIRNLEIFDPIGKSLEVYKACFQLIKECIEQSLSHL